MNCVCSFLGDGSLDPGVRWLDEHGVCTSGPASAPGAKPVDGAGEAIAMDDAQVRRGATG
jgi:hypothetical protein